MSGRSYDNPFSGAATAADARGLDALAAIAPSAAAVVILAATVGVAPTSSGLDTLYHCAAIA
ncbi:hypothetical protein ACQI4L_28580 [Mycolicibacterium litorale]|uniref:hypothetical protein n=1 Tax=Mycolicibacterium litorale TaxID=758802 RepID=UPI003CF8F074